MGLFSCRKDTAVIVSDFQPTNTGEPTQPPKLRVFPYEELATATSNFSASTFLGRGSHGSVFLAALDGGHLLAAAKVPSSPPPDDPTTLPSSNTNNEILILSSIPYSPLLVNLIGYTHGGVSARVAVVELMPRGSLHELLHHPLRPAPHWAQRLRLARRAAEAVAQLHALDPPVVHRDIKPSNVLIDANSDARLGDFGLAVRLPSRAAPAGTMGYIDPGYVSASDLSTKIDVYSFGVVLLEMMSGRRAIDVEHSPPTVVDWAAPLIATGQAGRLCDPRLGKVENCERVNEVAELAGRCVGADVELRPSMAEVATRLRAMERRAVGGARAGRGWRALCGATVARLATGSYPTRSRRLNVHGAKWIPGAGSEM